MRTSACVMLSLVCLGLLPAGVRGLRGILATTPAKVFSDCKAEGQMEVDLQDLKSPRQFVVVHNPLIDADGNEQGRWGRPATTLDATTYADASPSVSACRGINIGNWQGNARKVGYPETPNTEINLFDLGRFRVLGTCSDCPYGEFPTQIKQRVWARIDVVWQAGSQDMVPEWAGEVRFRNIYGQYGRLRITGSHTAGSGVELAGGSHTDYQGTPTAHPAAVDDSGAAQVQQVQGSWTGATWNPNNSRSVSIEAEYEWDKTYPFHCQQTTTHPSEDLNVSLRWSLSVEDASGAQQPDPAQTSTLLVYPKYGQLLMLWAIDVTHNCDITTHGCPCDRFREGNPAHINGKPNVP